MLQKCILLIKYSEFKLNPKNYRYFTKMDTEHIHPPNNNTD